MTTTPPHRYTAALAAEIELRWQDFWDANGTFEAPNPAGPLADPGRRRRGPKLFVLDMFPYPSGSGLHVGHPLGFIGTDVYGRYQRMAGRNVLYTMGFDAFGLPAEQFAVQTGTHPAITTAENVATYRAPDPPARAGHDRRRSIATTDPATTAGRSGSSPRSSSRGTTPTPRTPMAAWGRPIAELRRRVRRRHPPARRRPAAWSSLSAVEQAAVIDDQRLAYVAEGAGQLVPRPGHGGRQRGGHRRRAQRSRQLPGLQAHMRQWMMRITAYADRLLDDLDTLEWTDSLKTDAAQLDRPLERARTSTSTRRPGRSRCSRLAPTRCSGPRSWCSPEHPLVADLTRRGEAPARRRGYRRQAAATERTSTEEANRRRPACSPGGYADQPGHRQPTSRSGSPTTC